MRAECRLPDAEREHAGHLGRCGGLRARREWAIIFAMQRAGNPLFAVGAAWLAFALTACTSGADPLLSQSDDPMRSPSAGGAALSRAALDALLERASDDLGLNVDEIRVVRAEAVTWSDGSNGCPQEGMAYTQALVPGYRVVLDAAGERIHYHAGGQGEFVRCDDPSEPISVETVDR